MKIFGTLVRVALGAALLTGATLASAQYTGSRIGHTSRAGDTGDAIRALQIVAECVADRRTGVADRMMRVLPGTAEESRLINGQVEDLGMVCMDNREFVMDGRQLTLPPAMFRREVTIALAKNRAPRAPEQSPLPADSDPWFMPIYSALPAGARVDRNALVRQDFGHCVVVHEWAGAKALLRSNPESPEEAAAVRQLTPHLGSCLTEGSTMRITPATLREAMAEPFLQILATERQTGQGG